VVTAELTMNRKIRLAKKMTAPTVTSARNAFEMRPRLLSQAAPAGCR
jgi:hypothetical protein